jgi:dCTP deaminase
MTLLNDIEIRKRCLVPNLFTEGHAFNNTKLLPNTHLFTEYENNLYNVKTGHKVDQSTLKQIKESTKPYDKIDDKTRMIYPFIPEQVRYEDGEKVISYGTSSMGYDVRLGRKFKIFTNVFNALIDPLNMPDNAYVDYEGDFVVIPPNSYVLGHTIESFNIPRDITAVCLGKSTYARVGCGINVTPIEAGFVGNVVIEISNLTNLPMKVYSGQGIAQFLFLQGDPCSVSYADRGGKYQGQSGIQTAIV